MLLKEGYHLLYQIIASPNDVPVQRLAVIVEAAIHYHLTRSKKVLKLAQSVDTPTSLRHNELVKYLVAILVAASVQSSVLPDKTDREASFPVYKTQYPTQSDQPFLLIICTPRIVTAVALHRIMHSDASTRRFSDVPAYGQILLRQRPSTKP